VILSDALKKTSALQDTDEETEYKDFAAAVQPTSLNEMHILHSAVGILRNPMAGITYTADVHAPVEDTNIQKCAEFVPAITLDLSLQINHEFGSKNLIDLPHSLGQCMSYDEFRSFLTSVADYEANDTDKRVHT